MGSQNSIENSNIINSGKIILGNVSVNIGDVSKYADLSTKLASKKSERDVLVASITELNHKQKADDAPYLSELIDTKRTLLAKTEEEIDDLMTAQNEVIRSISSILSMLSSPDLILTDKDRYLEEVKQGNIQNIFDEIESRHLLGRRDLLKDVNKDSEDQLLDISNTLLLKAQASLLISDDTTGRAQAYSLFKESVDSLVTINNLTEFADFLEEFRVEEVAEVDLLMISKFRNEISDEKLADLNRSISSSYHHQRRFGEANDYLCLAIEIYERINTRSIVLNLSLLAKLAACYSELASGYGLNSKTFPLAEMNFAKAKKIYEDLNKSDNKYRVEYSNYISSYINLLRTKRVGMEQLMRLIDEYIEIQNDCFVSQPDERDKRIANILTVAADLQIRWGQPDLAYQNLKKAEALSLSVDNLYHKDNITHLGLIYRNLSHVYERKDDIHQAIRCMQNAVLFLKIRRNINEYEANDTTAAFLVELSELFHKSKDAEQYLMTKFEALELYNAVFSRNWSRDVQGILGTFQKLNLFYVDYAMFDRVMNYFRKLNEFLEKCVTAHPSDQKLKAVKWEIRRNSARFNHLVEDFGDVEWAKRVYVEILNEMDGVIEDEGIGGMRSECFRELYGLGVRSVEIKGQIKQIKVSPNGS